VIVSSAEFSHTGESSTSSPFTEWASDFEPEKLTADGGGALTYSLSFTRFAIVHSKECDAFRFLFCGTCGSFILCIAV
jgi:hypothetical protein